MEAATEAAINQKSMSVNRKSKIENSLRVIENRE